MGDDDKKKDWSKGHLRDALIWQRKGMWRPDTLDKLAAWMDLRPGMKAVDVGCGLGFLGYTFWPYFGLGGSYYGIDLSEKLIADARQSAGDWAEDGKARFAVGDAYALPAEDESADWVMCQTLMMHLERPEDALAEMIRVARPGGLISCNEPDNLSASMAHPYSSLTEMPIEQELLFHKISIISNRGRIKLGNGDMAIGNKLGDMMSRAGLVEIDIRQNDKVQFVQPPYEDETQRDNVNRIRKFMLDEGTYQARVEEGREHFLAGGGDIAEYEQSLEWLIGMRAEVKEQLEKGVYRSCVAFPYYTIKGRKPA